MNATISLAQQHGGGAILRAADGTRYTVRDFSPATGDVYGYGYPEPGEYRRLPSDLIAVENVRRHAGLWLSSLDREQHDRTCGYWYTVSNGAGGAHTAFRTRAALVGWLELTGLELTADLPADGVASSQRLGGEYIAALTMGPLPAGRQFRTLNNGRWSVGTRAAGCLWTQNVNVAREELDYQESGDAVDAGRFYLDGEGR